MTTAVGDSIRSMIGKTKKENRSRDRRKRLTGQPDHGSADEPCVRVALPPAEIMEIDLPGGGAAEALGRRRLGEAATAPGLRGGGDGLRRRAAAG